MRTPKYLHVKSPKYLHVKLKDGTFVRFIYDDVDFKFTREYFTVVEVDTNLVRFTAPRENLMYFECNDDEYITEVRR